MMKGSFNRIRCKAFAFVGIVLFASSVPVLLSAAIGKLAVTIKKISSSNITNDNNETQASIVANLVSKKIDDLITNNGSSARAFGYRLINNSDPSTTVGTLTRTIISATTTPVDVLLKNDTCDIITKVRTGATGNDPQCSSSKMNRHDSIARPGGTTGSVAATATPTFGGYVVKVFGSSIVPSDPTKAEYDLRISAYVCDAGSATNALCNSTSNIGIKTMPVTKTRRCPDTSSAPYSVAYGKQLIVANDPGQDFYNLNCSCPDNGVIQSNGSCTCAPGKSLSGSTCVNCTAGTTWSLGGLVTSCNACSGCSGAACSVTSGCTTCSSGKKISSGDCVNCVSGSTWSPGGTSTTCSSCSGCSGSTCNVGLGCTSCLAGNKLVSGNCVPCGSGEWSTNGNSSSTCTSCTASGCSAGSCSASLGCTSCPSGTRLSNGSCVSCDSGQWSSGGTSTTCSSCSGCASSCGGGTACSSCTAGNALNSGVCTPCVSGSTWSAGGGVTSCTSCSTSSGCNSGSCTVSSGCSSCLAGNKLISGNCVACGSGEWSPGGTSTCSSCLGSQVTSCSSTTGGATNCILNYQLNGPSGASGTTCVQSCPNNCQTCSSSSICTVCNQNYYLQANGTCSSSCPAGTYADTANRNCPSCPTLTWSPGGTSNNCQSCSTQHATSCNPTSGVPTACADGYILEDLYDVLYNNSGESSWVGPRYLCRDCPPHCKRCSLTTQCNICFPPYYYQAGIPGVSQQCGLTCPSGYYPSTAGGVYMCMWGSGPDDYYGP